MHLICTCLVPFMWFMVLFVQVGGACLPRREEYPVDDDFEEETKARVVSAYYYRVGDIHLRDDLDPTEEERKILPYSAEQLQALSEMTFGKHDGMYTPTPLFESNYKYFTDGIKEKGSPTCRVKGQLSVLETLLNWQWVAGHGK